MSDINNVIFESLSSHFKKHWKKYAAGLGAVALGTAGYAAHGQQKLKEANKYLKRTANWNAAEDAVHGGIRGYATGKVVDNAIGTKNLGKYAAGANATIKGVKGLIGHHLARHITNKIIDRDAHWWNAHKRAEQKNTVGTIASLGNTARNVINSHRYINKITK